jgi:hypothetical protein
MQLDEAFGPVNRWYCSEHFGYEVQDRETLLRYYIQHGGASFFAAHKSPLRRTQQDQSDDKNH